MKNFKFILIVVATLVLGLLSFFVYKKLNLPKEIHYHAGFVVFQNGQKVDFSDLKYMFIKPCSVNQNKKLTVKEVQMEKAHLHDGVGDVVHVEAVGAKWSDLFTNIGYPIDYASASGYINGNLAPGFQDSSINPYDSLVIFVGKADESLLSQSIATDHIKQVESKSVECGN